MVWQDMLMMVVNIIFSVALVPQVYHGFKEKKGFITLATSAPTFIGLFATAFALYTLSLFFAASASAVAGILWLILSIQRIVYEKAR